MYPMDIPLDDSPCVFVGAHQGNLSMLFSYFSDDKELYKFWEEWVLKDPEDVDTPPPQFKFGYDHKNKHYTLEVEFLPQGLIIQRFYILNIETVILMLHTIIAEMGITPYDYFGTSIF